MYSTVIIENQAPWGGQSKIWKNFWRENANILPQNDHYTQLINKKFQQQQELFTDANVVLQ